MDQFSSKLFDNQGVRESLDVLWFAEADVAWFLRYTKNP